MADRYWVGGTGTWNTTSTTNWSASSGGASGASVPTVADNVFFDQAGTYTVTMTGSLTCLDITVSAGTVTFATGASPFIDIRGSMSLVAGTVWSSTGAITFSSTTTGRTITTNGTSIAAFTEFNGIGGGWTLGSAFTTFSLLSFRAGTFDTSSVGNYAVSCATFQIVNQTGTRVINLNGSTVSISATGGFTQIGGTVTFNAGTSQINLTGQATRINASGFTFNNVTFTSTIIGSHGNVGSNTFNNLTFTGPALTGQVTHSFDSQQTINGTLSTTGTAGNRRVFITSGTYGVSVDLVVNSAPSLTDADFRGFYVRGTSAPISGTRIGNRGECRNITFSTPKTVYWNLAGAQNWSANGWATTSTGVPSTDNFPLPQDTATFTNAGSVTGTITLDTAIAYCPNVDMSGRTTAMTLGTSNATTVYGNWTNGSGTAFTGTGTLTFSGGGTQTITSAGKTFTCPITIDTYGGTVQLADALDIGSNTLTVTNGTFTTVSYAVGFGVFSSNNSNVRTISLGASAVTSYANNGGLLFGTTTNLTFNAGTSQITLGGSPTSFSVQASGLTFYNVLLDRITPTTYDITGQNTFNNLTITGPVIGGLNQCSFSANQTINGTLTCNGAAAAQRIFLRSNTLGTPRTITAAAISATDCDFRDINLAGAAAGSSPTRAGDCGNNTGITFPAAKTVYWNLAGAQNWNATAWATSSGGAPAVNNFPLAQDTAVFDNAGAAGTVTIGSVWNVGTFDASLRTSAMTLSASTISPLVYGDWKFGTGVTSSSTTGTVTFAENGTQTITSNGVQFGCNVTGIHPSGTVQLADALSLNSARTLTLTAGTFDAVTYNVTAGLFSNGATTNTLKMGTGTWTLAGTGTPWNCATAPTLIASTSTIVFSDTSTTARQFNGGGRYYNKLTIGGATGVSTLTITGDNSFGELASTKTVAHTIALGTTTQTFGKWSVTGTVGNVVTLTGTGTTHVIAGPAVTGIDYLAMGSIGFSTTSPGEFYAGANSTGTAAAPVFRTAAPAPRTLYWVGGTGNWSSTAKWSTSSGGASGAAIPTSLDAVVFDSASNATAYTATIDAGVTLARCASFTMAGPAAGNVTFAGSVGIAFHGNVSFAATGITRTYTGAMQWAGNASYTFTTNGVGLASVVNINGIGATWTLGSAFSNSNGVNNSNLVYGTFNTSTSNYNVTFTGILTSSGTGVRSLTLNNSLCSFGQSVSGGTTQYNAINLTFAPGNSTIEYRGTATTWGSTNGPVTFYNVIFTSSTNFSLNIIGNNTFNNLTFTGRTIEGITAISFNSSQTITGTLTVSAGTASAYRTFLASDTLGTTRTLTCAAVSATDVDFRDITIAGAAAPASGTRLGNAKGNSGITFTAAKTVYWAVNTADWGATGAGSWSATSGGAAANDQFPLAQDTAYIPFATPTSGSTIAVNANYNIGTIEMSNRNGSALVTLNTGSTTPAIYGNWVNGTGTTLVGTGVMTFAGRTTQQITSAGRTFSQRFDINTPSGSVTLQDAFICNNTTSNVLNLTTGTFDANGYAVTFSATVGVGQVGTTFGGVLPKTLAIGSGTWILAGSGTPWDALSSTNLTSTGTGTISLTSAFAKTFAGGGVSYSGITLNQGGAGALTITGNNTFKTITNTYSATGATSIAFGGTTTTLTDPWTATGAATRVLTISGSPANLVYTGSGTAANVDYLSISNVRGYPLVDEWYAGPNSTNGGSLGWYFVAATGTVYFVTVAETGTGTDSISAGFLYLGTVSELATSSDAFAAAASFRGVVSESGTGTDSISARSAIGSAILESATLADTDLARLIARATLSETATITDASVGRISFPTSISETATGTDTDSATRTLRPSVSESATGTETVATRYIARPNIAETATGTDAVSARAAFRSAVSESATITDLISAIKGYFVFIVESATGTETVSPRYIARPNIAESATGTEAIATRYIARPNIAETATGTETVSPRYIARPSISESATGTDTDAAKLTAAGTISETATGTEAITARATFKSNISESAVAQELVQAFFVAAAQVSELATGSDQVSALRALAAAVVETATLTDSVSARAVFLGLLQEAATAQDAVNAPGSAYNILMQELAQAQDALTTTAVFPVSLSETATGTQTNSAAFIPLATITESATITDVASALQAFAASISETSAAADSVLVAPSIFNAIAVAAATAIDNFNPAGSIYNVTVPESATLSDSVIGAFLWNLINDSQNVTWSLVDAAQPATWAHVEASQSGGWNIIPITTDRYGPTWAASAAGGGTAILLNGQQTTDGYQQYMLYRNGAWIVPRLTIPGVFNSIQYINGQYFVYSANTSVSYGAKLLRSTDGLNWSAVTTLPTSTPDTRQVVGMFGNGSTIVIAYNNLTYISTDNCATWTASSALPGDLQGVVVGFAFGAGLYVMCDGRRVFTSANALTWTQAVSFTGVGWSGQRGSVSWSGSRFVVIARSTSPSASPQIRTSTNGITWTTVSPPSPLSTQAVWAFWDGSQFVFATAGAGSTNAAFYAANSTLTTFTLLGYLPGRFYIPTIQASYLMGSINGQYIPPGFASPATGTFYTSPNFSTFNAINAAWPINAWGVLDASTATSWNDIPGTG